MIGLTEMQARQLALLTRAWQHAPEGTTYSVLSALCGKGLAERMQPQYPGGKSNWRLTVEGERRLMTEEK